ncbi:MAG: hypothetical protein IKC93_01370 [Candidatus Methanomethylophilaceae archaeon]|nr:hypothetical protein [Candidatus Methanomethylophilaceae archaeon]
MTLTTREAMQALLDGKTLEHDIPWYLVKLDDKGDIVVCNSMNPLKKGEFTERYTLISKMDRIYEEYRLTFEQALREMLDGKVVMCEVFNDREYFYSDGWFRFQYHDDDWAQADWFEMRMRDAKWKVVE